jgi:hypothetical protein
MHELTFYRQMRYDGGIRMGVELDDQHPLLYAFTEGPPEEQDNPLASALLWYFDLRCKGEGLPTTPDGARAWLLDHEGPIRDGLREFIAAIALGVDDSTPIRWDRFDGFPEGIRVEAVVSSIRRVTNEELLVALREIAENFGPILGQLAPGEPAIP